MKLTRSHSDNKATIGCIQLGKHRPIYTLELPWQANSRNISCIPKGKYECVPAFYKNRHAYRLTSVPGRSGILIHIGNFPKEIRGCILPGLHASYFAGKPCVWNSGAAMALIRELAPNGFELEVR